jgi:hypothetical protein
MQRRNTHAREDSATSSRTVLTLLIRSKFLPSNMASAAHNELPSIFFPFFFQTEAMLIRFERLFCHLSLYSEITLTNKIPGIRCCSHRCPCIRKVKATYVSSCITCHFRIMSHFPWLIDAKQKVSHLLVDSYIDFQCT